MTLRLPEDLADQLETLAQVEEMPVAEAARVAISDLILARSNDPDFQARLRRQLEKNNRALQLLAND